MKQKSYQSKCIGQLQNIRFIRTILFDLGERQVLVSHRTIKYQDLQKSEQILAQQTIYEVCLRLSRSV